MSIKKSDRFMGEPIAGSIEKLSDIKGVQKNPSVQPAQSQPVVFPTPASNIRNPQDYIIVPGASYEKYSYPDMLVSMKLEYHNTDWNQAHSTLLQLGAQMLTIRQFVDFLKVLRSGTAYDGTGRIIDKNKISTIFNEITEVRDPWRSEWLDAKFEERRSGGFLGLGFKWFVNINYGHTLQNNQLSPAHSEKLNEDWIQDRGIEYWIKNSDEHGLPRYKRRAVLEEIDGWRPDSGTVARFCANSNKADLCCKDPTNRSPSLGVRIAYKKV